MKYPLALRFTRDHEWAKIEGKRAVIGIIHHAQAALGAEERVSQAVHAGHESAAG